MDKKDMATRLYSTTEAAKLCRVTPGTIIYWIKKGKLETALTAGGHRRISGSELLRLINQLHLPLPEELISSQPDHSARILVVDDEASIRQMIQWVLKESFPKAKVEEAENGFIAGWKTQSFKPDLVILDLMMPGVDGFKYCEMVRHLPELKHVKIIAMSGIQGFGFEEKINQIGADDFVAKPFVIEALKTKISEQLKMIEREKGQNQ